MTSRAGSSRAHNHNASPRGPLHKARAWTPPPLPQRDRPRGRPAPLQESPDAPTQGARSHGDGVGGVIGHARLPKTRPKVGLQVLSVPQPELLPRPDPVPQEVLRLVGLGVALFALFAHLLDEALFDVALLRQRARGGGRAGTAGRGRAGACRGFAGAADRLAVPVLCARLTSKGGGPKGPWNQGSRQYRPQNGGPFASSDPFFGVRHPRNRGRCS